MALTNLTVYVIMRNMKKIPLTQGKFALIDDIDYAFLSQWNWRVDPHGYAIRHSLKSEHGEGPRTTVKMHRSVLQRVETLIKNVDHINRDKLDNRRSNLRQATTSQNGQNTNPRRRFKGVYFSKDRQKFRARIFASRWIDLGYFDDIVDAAKAYNKAALEHFREFARLNDV